MEEKKIPIAITYGDGIGPEILQATIDILKAANAPLEYHEIMVGQKIFEKGSATGIEPKSWEVLKNTCAFLKAPIMTPQGKGFRSINVTIRTNLGLFANIRPCRSYYPFIQTKHPEMDVIIVRENEEDLYCGIEYQQSPNVCQSLKFISRQGSERIIRFAFGYAKQQNRKKVTCFVKDNIMKLSDGLFHQVFDTLANKEHDLITDHRIVDIGSAELANTPEIFDVIVLPNLYGDILSDIAAQITGSVGLAGSANIGEKAALFEAVHGTAPQIAGKDLANPSGLIQASIMMLLHLQLPQIAEKIQNAWLKTVEEGTHTSDIYNPKNSQKKVGCKEFTETVISNLGQFPSKLSPAQYSSKSSPISTHPELEVHETQKLVGIDVYIQAKSLEAFLPSIEHIAMKTLHLQKITNRGAEVWPNRSEYVYCVDQFRTRFFSNDDREVAQSDILQVLHSLNHMKIQILKAEFLFEWDGRPGFSA